MKLIFSLLFITFCLGSKAQQKADGPRFKFVEEIYDFKTVKQGEVVVHEFVFTNSGNAPLVITNCSASCGCTIPEWPKTPINPGQKGIIKASFNTAGKVNFQQKAIFIESNVPAPEGKQKYEIYLKGTIEAPATPAQNTTPNGNSH